MKHLALIPVLLISAISAKAQLTKEQRIQDSVIGWDPKNKYDHYLKPQSTPEGKQKLAYVDKMVQWVKQSYTPVGSLGEYIRVVGSTSYGLNLTTWYVGYDYLDEQKHFRPIPEENVPYYFVANQVFGTWPIDFLNKKGEVFFAMQPNGYAPSGTEEKKRQNMNKSIHPNVSKYITWINEWTTIYLAPNNKLPMIPVTRGELLDKAAASMDGVFEENKKAEAQRWQGNTKGYEGAIEYIKKEIDKYRDNIVKLKEKYKNSLNEPALTVDMQPNWRSFSADSWDVFKGAPNTTYYPIYKFDAATLAKMKGPQPLWLAIALPFRQKTDGNAEYELFTAMTQNLNYDYIYNYFFDPEKVKGKAYTPANEAELKARLDAYRKKNNADNTAMADTKAWAGNVHFQEDYANAADGGEPVNWYFRRTDEHDKVVTRKDQPGKWLQLGYNNQTYPTLIKKPFPKNFTLEFDLLTDDFSGSFGGGVELYLTTNLLQPNGSEKGSPQSVGLSITLTAGNAESFVNNYRGELRTKLYKKPEVNTQNFNAGAVGKMPLQAFNNKKNKVHVGLQVSNGNFKIFIDGKEVMTQKDWLLMYDGKCVDCSMPADLNFNSVYWRANQSGTHVYLGNIKLTRE